MNLEEYEKKLRSLNTDELKRFNSDFGGGEKTVNQRLREFVEHPNHERRICQLLGLKTEAEKITDATIDSAKSARQSTRSARLSIFIATIALLISSAQAIINSPIIYDNLKKPMLLVVQGNDGTKGGKNVFLISNPSRSKTEGIEIRLAIKKTDTVSFLITDRKIGKISYSEMKGQKGNSLNFLKVAIVTFEKFLPGEFASIIVEKGLKSSDVHQMIFDGLPAVISAVHSEGFAKVNGARFSLN